MRGVYNKINELVEKEEVFALATIVNHKGSVPRRLAKMIVRQDGTTHGTIGGGCVEGEVAERAVLMMKEGFRGAKVETFDLIEEEYGGVGMNCGGQIDVSIEIVEPDPRLIVVGSGHMSAAIANLARALGFEVIVIDPLAKKEKFPGAHLIITDFPESGMSKIKAGRFSYIIVVTRHKDDLPALRAALKTDAVYVGLIGSKRRVAQVFQLLLKEGYTTQQLARIYAPIGLDIGAETPDEIAVSIMGQVVQVRRLGASKPAEPMKLKDSVLKALGEGHTAERAVVQSE
jgi:xanthine dehydrogenase accessory factor